MATATFTKDVFVDFYRASVEQTGDATTARRAPRFEDLLQASDKALATVHGYPVRLRHLESIGSQWVGEIIKHRIYDPAVKAAQGGDPVGLNVMEGETLISMVCFLYDPGLNCFALERNRLAASTGSIASYLTQGRTDITLDFSMMIEPDALARIGQMQSVRYLTFSLASFGNLANVRREAPTISHGIQLAREFDAPSISVKIGMSHQRGSLSLQQVMAAARDLLRLRSRVGEHSVSSVKVCGAEDPENDPNNVVDLIEDRLTYHEEVRLGHDPGHLYQVRRDLLLRAWRNRREDISCILRSSPAR